MSGPTQFALIIGAMKSGTTSLFEVLSQHPEIAGSAVKEPEYFAVSDVWEKGWDWYLDLWNWDPRRHRVALEASTTYTTYPAVRGVPQRIASVSDAHFRFIYLMRDPLTQIPSNVRHSLYAGWGSSLDEGIPEWMIETVSYAMQIDQFTAFFPKEQVLLLTLEEYREAPSAVLRRICTFLGVDFGFEFVRPQQRYNTGEAFELSPFWARVVKAGPVKKVAYGLLPRPWRHRIRSALPRLVGTNASLGRYELNEEERAFLAERLAPDLRRLESEYGVDVHRRWGLALPR